MKVKIILVLLTLFLLVGCSNKNLTTQASSNLELIDFNGQCDKSAIEPAKTKILEKKLDSNILKIKILTSANCCGDFEGKIEHSDSDINLEFIQTGDPCYCMCASTLYYEINGATSKNYNLELNNEKLD